MTVTVTQFEGDDLPSRKVAQERELRRGRPPTGARTYYPGPTPRGPFDVIYQSRGVATQIDLTGPRYAKADEVELIFTKISRVPK